MAYFPLFIEMDGMDVLIVGGGTVALRKLEKLLPYGASVTVAAPRIDPRIEAVGAARLIYSPFQPELLTGRGLVIAATDDGELNHEIAGLCGALRIPVNVVDDKEYCSFLFPSLVRRGKLSVGISTSGACPSAAIWLKERVNDLLPQCLPEILDYLESLRPILKERISREELRSRVFKKLFERCMAEGRVLKPTELETILAEEK